MMKRIIQIYTVAAALLPTATAQGQAPRPLTFCAAFENLPMSEHGTPAGFEIEFAEALAQSLGREARFEWIDPVDDLVENVVLEGRCDAALGAIVEPGEMVGARPVTGVALTEPYYSAGYHLIRAASARPVRTLEELRETRIALEGESIVTYTLRQKGQPVHVLRTFDGVVRALADGRAEYGYLWGPVAAWLLRERSDVVMEPEFRPTELWNFAMAVRETDEDLRQALNRSIREMVESGSLAGIFSKYQVPYIAPAPVGPANAS